VGQKSKLARLFGCCETGTADDLATTHKVVSKKSQTSERPCCDYQQKRLFCFDHRQQQQQLSVGDFETNANETKRIESCRK
jgi:hypothetical protein